MKRAIIVPTLNAASGWQKFALALLACASPREVLVVDSESTDGTPDLARSLGFQVVRVERSKFNHGGTRQWAAQFVPDAELLVFLTQDAILANSESLQHLTDVFQRDSRAGASFGRQLARPAAGAIERHARLFNYPPESSVRSISSKESLGFKAIFLSNSFAAYRRRALERVGGFPSDVILGEDTITAARLLQDGWTIHYIAEARAYHSHDYSCWQEFKRYFDTGVLHARASWLRQEFGGTGGEGKRFVMSELDYLWHHQASAILSALLRTCAKLAGYRLGMMEEKLDPALKARLSMHSNFWKR